MSAWIRLKRILSLSCAEAAELSSRRVASSIDESIEATDGLSGERKMRIARAMRDAASE